MFSASGVAGGLTGSRAEQLCLRCLRRLARGSPAPVRRTVTTLVPRRNVAQGTRLSSSVSAREYFWANNALFGPNQAGGRLDRHSGGMGDRTQAMRTPVQSALQTSAEELPHRRRRKRIRENEPPVSQTPEADVIPPDASSRLTTASASAPPSSLRRRLALYLSLSKPRLTFLVVLTTTVPYCIYPTPDLLSSATTAAPSLSALTLLFLTAGTALASSSANTFNMLFEPKYDAQMSRTRNRPLVRKLISPRAAAVFGVVTGLAGVAALYFGCNPTTSFLGAANIALYAGVYTPMKRISVINTWVGALVGAIPPLMGWTAAAGQYAADGTWRELLFTDQATGGWLLAALLFAWQFPHFNALSHTIRHEYANAGYRMLCSVNPARNARVALRYSLLMFPICFGLAACGIVGGGSATAPTTILWTVGSSAVNGWVCMRAVSFWRWQGEKGSARGLFWASVWHLPILLVLAMALKRGVWQRLGESLGVGRLEDDDPDDAVLPEPLAPYDARQARSGVSSVASGT